MKTIGGGTVLGIIFALGMIYWLQPLNTGAVVLITLLCIGIASLFVKLLEKMFRKKVDHDE